MGRGINFCLGLENAVGFVYPETSDGLSRSYTGSKFAIAQATEVGG
jgi:hypothetical protein